MSLVPSKHQHPDLTTLAMAGRILVTLRRKRSLGFEALRTKVCSTHSASGPLFVPALLFLYALALADYHPKTDSFVYTGK